MKEKIEELKNEFLQFPQWEDRYKKLIELGRKLPEMPEEEKIEKNRIKGCQSQVWLKPSFEEGKIYFMADSDAMLVKGIVAILVQVYSGATPQEILEYKPTFLSEIGITEHLSMNRTNGLASMVKQIQMYALAYKTMTQA